jgi:hypothetical protein
MKILPTAYCQLPTEKRDEGRGKEKARNVTETEENTAY